MKTLLALQSAALLALAAVAWHLHAQVAELRACPVEAVDALPEPFENATADVLDRIESLRQHLDYQPSREWIAGLLDDCRLEIAALRAYR